VVEDIHGNRQCYRKGILGTITSHGTVRMRLKNGYNEKLYGVIIAGVEKNFRWHLMADLKRKGGYYKKPSDNVEFHKFRGPNRLYYLPKDQEMSFLVTVLRNEERMCISPLMLKKDKPFSNSCFGF